MVLAQSTLLTTEALKALINYGVLGIIAVIFLSPIAWLLWQAARGIKVHGEETGKKFKEACMAVINTQPQMLESIEKNTIATLQLGEVIAKANNAATALVNGNGISEAHPFSSLRLEECLLHFCGLIDSRAQMEMDTEVRANLLMYSGKMRRVLERKLNNER